MSEQAEANTTRIAATIEAHATDSAENLASLRTLVLVTLVISFLALGVAIWGAVGASRATPASWRAVSSCLVLVGITLVTDRVASSTDLASIVGYRAAMKTLAGEKETFVLYCSPLDNGKLRVTCQGRIAMERSRRWVLMLATVLVVVVGVVTVIDSGAILASPSLDELIAVDSTSGEISPYGQFYYSGSSTPEIGRIGNSTFTRAGIDVVWGGYLGGSYGADILLYDRDTGWFEFRAVGADGITYPFWEASGTRGWSVRAG